MSEHNGNGKPENLKWLDKIKHPKKRVFLQAFCECFQVTKAAAIAEIERTMHYHWLDRDPDYVEAFEVARHIGAETLESELIRRAFSGVRKQKFYKGEPILVSCRPDHPDAIGLETGGFVRPYVEYDFADTLGIFLLKGAMPEKYRERYEYHEGDEEINETIDRELATMANRETSIATSRDPHPGSNGNGNGAA